MFHDIRIALLLLCHGLLLLVFAELNRLISPFGFYLMVDALFVTFAALYLRLWPMVIVTSITAAFVFSFRPFPFTLGVLLFPLIALLASRLRKRIRRENARHFGIVALGINTLLFCIYTLKSPHLPGESLWLTRLLSDFALSQILLVILAPLWSDSMVRLLYIFGIDVRAELQQV